jgi:hypothetical protein
MSMSVERAQMRMKLANLQQHEKQLRMQIEDLCATIRANLNTALTPAADLDIAATAGLMDELQLAWAKLQAALSEISRLEGDLV